MEPDKIRLIDRALLRPVPILIMLTGFALAAALRDVLGGVLLAASVAGACVYAAFTASRPSFVRDVQKRAEQLDAREAAHRREMMIETLEAQSRVKVKEIIRNQREIAAEMDGLGTESVSPEFSEIALQTGRLVERAVTLSCKRGDLLSYLRKADPDAVRSRIGDLKAKLAGTPGERDRLQLESAIDASEKELANVQTVTDTSDRILLELDSMSASFAGLRSEFAKLRSENVENWLSAIDSLKATVGGIQGAADSLDSALDGVSWASAKINT